MNSVQENQKHVPIDSQLKRHWRNRKRLRLILGVIILLLIVAGFFYWYEKTSQAEAERQRNEGRITEEERLAKVPVLFGKEDYRVEQKADGQYLIIDRVGFSAPIPSGWQVEYETTTDPEQKEYRINIISPSMSVKNNTITSGCGINISAGFNPEGNYDTNQRIKFVKGEPINDESLIWENFDYQTVNITNTLSLKWSGPVLQNSGQRSGLEIPIKDQLLIMLNTRLSGNDKILCSNLWDQFIKGIVLK